MSRICFLLACVAAVTLTFADLQNKNIDVQVMFGDINLFRAENPAVKIIPFNVDPKIPRRYTLGNRVSGDKLVGQARNSSMYQSPQNVSLRLNYPQSGVGAIVSFVEVNVNQSSNIGKAYAISGGIRQRRISVFVEALNTTFLKYNAAIYGY